MPGDDDGLRGSRAANRVHDRLVADRLVLTEDRLALGAVGVRDAAAQGALPGDLVRLVEGVEDHAGVAGERGRHRAPEVKGVVGVGHRRLGVARHRAVHVVAGTRTREPEDDVDAMRIEAGGVVPDRLPVRLTAEARVEAAVAADPAGLVERERDRVHPPLLHRLDRAVRDGALEEAVAVSSLAVVARARVLRAGAVDADQSQRLALGIDEVIAGDVDADGAGGRGQHGPSRAEQCDDHHRPEPG